MRFGLPISEPFLLDWRLTQDLQSARFFWTPDAASPVTLEVDTSWSAGSPSASRRSRAARDRPLRFSLSIVVSASESL